LNFVLESSLVMFDLGVVVAESMVVLAAALFELEDANQVSCVCNDIVTLDKSNASSNDKNNRQYLKQ